MILFKKLKCFLICSVRGRLEKDSHLVRPDKEAANEAGYGFIFPGLSQIQMEN